MLMTTMAGHIMTMTMTGGPSLNVDLAKTTGCCAAAALNSSDKAGAILEPEPVLK